MMLKTEVTQKLYAEVMGANPSKNKGDDKPVTNISWYDAIYFCNKLSEKYGRTPVYSLHGSTDVSKWGYKPHKRYDLDWDGIEQNKAANGFRLPANSEWEYAALGGKNFEYAGSNNPYEVAWFNGNSGNKIHPVAKFNPNKYGLYDMSGNVWEWVWDTLSGSDRYCRGGSYTADDDDEATCTIKNWDSCEANEMHESIGFRVICNNVN